MKKIAFLFVFAVYTTVLFAQPKTAVTAKDIVKKMTLEEKVHLVLGLGMNLPGATNSNGVVGAVNSRVDGAAGTTYAIPRLGIPTTILADGPAGVRIYPIRNNDNTKTYYCTAFPVATLLASSWDTDLVNNVGKAFGNEIKQYGVDIILGPALNIHRNPLGGRNFEYYSEDPIVTGNITAAMVNGIQSNGVGTSIKHFAANNQETNRMTVNTIVTERTLREIYLKGFQIAVKKSNPWTVMSSYNKINGTYASESYDLLTKVLRKEWGFKGYVMTDWFAFKDAVQQMKAGNDLLMPGQDFQLKQIEDGLKNKTLDEATITENAERILSIILQTPSYKKFAFTNKPDLDAHAAVSRNAAAQGMVLLKNKENTLPFTTSIKNIGVFGNYSYEFVSGGTGSGDVNEKHTVSLIEGLSKAGYTLNNELTNNYTNYIKDERSKQPQSLPFMLPPTINEYNIADDVITKNAANTDIAIVTIGRNAGEFYDRKLDNDFNVSQNEILLLKKVVEAYHAQNKKVVVLLNIGGVIETASWKDIPDAILVAWQPGQEAGHAVADILSGKVNPSGKLATTFPINYSDIASSKNFPGKNLSSTPIMGIGGFQVGVDAEVTYEEGIYVGYRFFNSFNIPTSYPFGFGLSYTNFSYSNLKLSSNVLQNKITVTVDVTNTGKVAGKEVAQLYITAPKGNVNKPSVELKGFAKTKLLKPNEKQQLSFEISIADVASYNTTNAAWIADAGDYTLKIAASINDVKQTAGFKVNKTVTTEKCSNVLTPVVAIKEMQ